MAAFEEEKDFQYPQREAAFFYGLFLRGHSVEELRRDIEIPPEIIARWNREFSQRPEEKAFLNRIVEYRRHVLAIFEALVNDRSQRIQ